MFAFVVNNYIAYIYIYLRVVVCKIVSFGADAVLPCSINQNVTPVNIIDTAHTDFFTLVALSTVGTMTICGTDYKQKTHST